MSLIAVTKRSAFVLALIVIALAINSTLYYFSTKKLLIEELETQMEAIAQQLRISIEQAEFGHQYIQAMLADNLRSASIAIQHALDPDIEKVTNEQLAQLRDQLNITNITLFKQTEDDIISYRSTDPKELDPVMSTKGWGYWYDAFNQLLALEPVTVEKGEALPNFWSGPFEVSTADPTKVEKWGYYYDGTTNYIIDPYINIDKINAYDQQIGPPAVIMKLLKANPSVKEITVFNHDIFGTTPKESKNANDETWVHLLRRPILYGSYTFSSMKDDVYAVKQSMKEAEIISRLDTIHGEKIYKSFVPVANTSLPYVIGISSDYSVIQDKLNSQFQFLAFTVLLGMLLSIIIVVAILQFTQKRKDKAVQVTQEAYIHEVNELFTSIRGQRHDFLNQVQTIHTMATMGKTEDLKNFTAELIGDIRVINDIIQIGNPAVAALIQAKIVAAADKKISFHYEISNLNDLKLGVKSVDIVKIIGNLVDNAFDEVASLHEDKRTVTLLIQETSGCLHIIVKNPGRVIPENELKLLFDSGYTTRSDGQHHGLGLAITKERVIRYKGTIQATSNEDEGITFEVKLPLEK